MNFHFTFLCFDDGKNASVFLKYEFHGYYIFYLYSVSFRLFGLPILVEYHDFILGGF